MLLRQTGEKHNSLYVFTNYPLYNYDNIFLNYIIILFLILKKFTE